MNLQAALQQPNSSVISSLDAVVVGLCGFKTTARGETLSIYKIEYEGVSCMLKIYFIEKVTLFAGCLYKINSVPTLNGLKGLEVKEYQGIKEIVADNSAIFDLQYNIYAQQSMEQQSQNPNSTMPPPPYSREDLENYMLQTYFSVRAKALTKEESGITDEQAHELAVNVVSQVPSYWFGQDKQLP